MAYKGRVFKVKPWSLIVMTGDFQFTEIRKNDAGAGRGDEVFFHDRDIVYPRSKNKHLIVAAACVLALFIVTGGLLNSVFMAKEVYAYVGMDINPSLELALSESYKVKSAEARNRDGEKILKDLSLEGIAISSAVEEIIEKSKKEGYVENENSRIMFTTSFENNAPHGSTTQKLEKELVNSTKNTMQKFRSQADVYVLNIDEKEREEAIENGVSPGRYMIWKKAREENKHLNIEDIKEENIGNLMQEYKNLGQYISQNAAAKWEKGGKPEEVPGREKNSDKSQKGRGNNGKKDFTPPGLDKQNNKNQQKGSPPSGKDGGNFPGNSLEEKDNFTPPGQNEGREQKEDTRVPGSSSEGKEKEEFTPPGVR